jgi:hypothetical protein
MVRCSQQPLLPLLLLLPQPLLPRPLALPLLELLPLRLPLLLGMPILISGVALLLAPEPWHHDAKHKHLWLTSLG